jgi:anthranilate synthase component 1
MFYLDCGDVQVVGASPEALCKVEENKVYSHAIAGTIKRGATPEGLPPLLTTLRHALTRVTEDEQLGQELLNSEKDRAEHIMLVDLARNEVHRVCQSKTVKVDHLQ